jgi:hypothetical protein
MGRGGYSEQVKRCVKEDESGEGDSMMKFGPVKGVSDEKREFGLRMG